MQLFQLLPTNLRDVHPCTDLETSAFGLGSISVYVAAPRVVVVVVRSLLGALAQGNTVALEDSLRDSKNNNGEELLTRDTGLRHTQIIKI